MHYDETNAARLISLSDEKAFKWAYEQYAPGLYVLAFNMLGSSDEAKGAVQTVFVKLWEERVELRITKSLRNYLYTCTKHYILNRIRHLDAERRHGVYISLMSSAEDNSLEERIDAKDRTVLLEHVTAGLPPQQRRVLALKQEGLSNAEIARKRGISVPTVKFHYAQLLRTLRRRLTSADS